MQLVVRRRHRQASLDEAGRPRSKWRGPRVLPPYRERERRGHPTMRIIAGEHRGRTIAAPPGLTTRPTPDRVRGALFSALESRLGGPGSLEGVRVLDLFAGSGALGLEALSRGAMSATFVERDRSALRALHDNIASLKVIDRARVLTED